MYSNNRLRKEIKMTDVDFPELKTVSIKEKQEILDYKNMKEIIKQKEKVKEGWVKLSYKNNKIIKEYGKLQKTPIKIEKESNFQNQVEKVIKKMVSRWEYEDKLKGNEVDYYLYYDINDYESDDENEFQDQDMNEDLIEDELNLDKF